jgi:hypothetical protein
MMRHYDGSLRWDRVEASLRARGYVLEFACMASYGHIPGDLGYTGRENGWELRRKIKAWCAAHGIADYEILRNTSYLKDLHGAFVYELWVKPSTPP